jgi:hypothetical protein
MDGTLLFNDLEVIEAMVAASHKIAELAKRPGPRPTAHTASGPSQRDIDRKREIEWWMAAPRGSRDYRRYYDDPAVQAEYRELLGSVGDATGSAHVSDSNVDRRIAEIEGLMGTRKYTEDVQAELLDLYRRREKSAQG